MAFPDPAAGLVIRYSYLWRSEAQEGREEGAKDRPCAIVVASKRAADGQHRVMVAPITHTPPQDPRRAVEIPPKVGLALGLDHAKSWIITSEVNTFTWPGPDIRPAQGGRFSYGRLPHNLAETMRQRVLDPTRDKTDMIERDEAKSRTETAEVSEKPKKPSIPSRKIDLDQGLE